MRDPLVNYLQDGGLPLTAQTKHGPRYLNQSAPQQAQGEQISGGGTGRAGGIGGLEGSGTSATGIAGGTQAGQGADLGFAQNAGQYGGVGGGAALSGNTGIGQTSSYGQGLGFRDVPGYGPSTERLAGVQQVRGAENPQQIVPPATAAPPLPDSGGGDGVTHTASTGALNPWGNDLGSFGEAITGVKGDPSGNTAGSFGYMTGGALGFLPGGSILQGLNNQAAIGRAQDFAGVNRGGFFDRVSTNPFDSIGTTADHTNVNFGGGVSGPGVTYDGGLIGGLSRAFGGSGAAGALTSGRRAGDPGLINAGNYQQFSTGLTPNEARRRGISAFSPHAALGLASAEAVAAQQQALTPAQTADRDINAATAAAQAHRDSGTAWSSDGDGGGSDYGSAGERDAVADSGWGSDAHFDAIDDQFDSNDGGGDDGGGK